MALPPVHSTTQTPSQPAGFGKAEGVEKTTPFAPVGDPSVLPSLEKKVGPADPAKADTVKAKADALAELLEIAAGSGSLDGFEYAQSELIKNGPQIAAHALLRIKKPAIATSLLLPLKVVRPDRYYNLLFYMDFFSDPARPSRRNQIEKWQKWQQAIQVADWWLLPPARLMAVLGATLYLLTSQDVEKNPACLSKLPHDYPEIGMTVIAVTQYLGSSSGQRWDILVRDGIGPATPPALQPVDPYQSFGFNKAGAPTKDRNWEEDKGPQHPAQQSREYRDMLEIEKREISLRDKTEKIDRDGNLVVRFYHSGDIVYYIFDQQGTQIETGYEGYPSPANSDE